jgi:hypothetical protein
LLLDWAMGESDRSILSALRLLFGLLITVALGRQLLLVLVFPVVYLIYTMVRAACWDGIRIHSLTLPTWVPMASLSMQSESG